MRMLIQVGGVIGILKFKRYFTVPFTLHVYNEINIKHFYYINKYIYITDNVK